MDNLSRRGAALQSNKTMKKEHVFKHFSIQRISVTTNKKKVDQINARTPVE
jgi:hypothetical protein